MKRPTSQGTAPWAKLDAAKDRRDQAKSRYGFSEPLRAAGPRLERSFEQRKAEHQMRDQRTGYAARNLRYHVEQGIAQRRARV